MKPLQTAGEERFKPAELKAMEFIKSNYPNLTRLVKNKYRLLHLSTWSHEKLQFLDNTFRDIFYQAVGMCVNAVIAAFLLYGFFS